jgi:hypothetical protein
MGKINWSALKSGKKNKEKKDESYLFKLHKDEHLLRIVPFPLNSKLFNSEYFNEENNLFVRLSYHNANMVPYSDDKMTLTLESVGQEDPICKFSKQLNYDNKYNDTKDGEALRNIAKGMLPERAFYCCVIDREDEVPTPYLWKIPSFDKQFIPLMEKASGKLKKKLKIDEDDDEFFEFDCDNGFDCTIETLEQEYNGNKFRGISSITFESDSTHIVESKEELKEIYKNMVSPFSLFNIKTAKELKGILEKAKNGDEDDDEDEDEEAGKSIASKPKSKAVASTKVLPKMDDEDDDDKDDEEKPNTKSKVNAKNFNELFQKNSKKKKPEDDEDDE